MMNDQLLAPDELFRRFQRDMLDQHTIISQILLNMIELAETQQSHGVLLHMVSEVLTGLGRDIAAIADLLNMPRPSQIGPADDAADENGSDESDADEPDTAGDE